MGLLDIFKKPKKEKPLSNSATVQFTKSISTPLIKDGVPDANKYVRRCVEIISNAIASTPLDYVYNNVAGETLTWKTGIASMLSLKPNSSMTAFSFWQKLISQGLITNDSFAWIVRDNLGNITEFIPITATSYRLVTVKEYPDISFIEFTLKKDGSKKYIAEEDLLHFRFQFSQNEYFGDDNLPLKGLVGIDDDIWNSVVHWSRNSAALRGVLQATGVLKDEDIESANARFKKAFLDTENSGGFLTLDSKFTFTALNGSNSGIDAEYLTIIKKSLCEYFGVNEALMDSSASPEQIQAFFQLRLKPVFTMIEQELNCKLITDRERSFGHKFNFVGDNLNHLSASDKNATVTMLTNLGCLTRNEIRQIYGWGKIPGGDVLVYSKNFEEVKNTKEKDESESNKQTSGEEESDGEQIQ